MLRTSMTEAMGFDEAAVKELSYQENDDITQSQNAMNDATGMNYRDENRLKTLLNVFNGYTNFE